MSTDYLAVLKLLLPSIPKTPDSYSCALSATLNYCFMSCLIFLAMASCVLRAESCLTDELCDRKRYCTTFSIAAIESIGFAPLFG